MTASLATLNPAAQVALASCEQRIERGLKTFIDVGQALAEIRDSRLYKGTYDTFEDYCRERWGFSRIRAHQLTSAADLALTMVNSGLPEPTNERQARALAAVPAADRAEVWREVNQGDRKPTAEKIREVAKARTAPPATPETACEPESLVPAPMAEHYETSAWKGDEPGCCGIECACGTTYDGFDSLAEAAEHLGRHIELSNRNAEILTPEPIASTPSAVAGSGSTPSEPEQDGYCLNAGGECSPGAQQSPPAPKPTLTLVTDADEQRAAKRRDARALLVRVVELLAPSGGKPGYIETWARQLGPYDDELAVLVQRAHDALAALDDLISEAGK